MCDRNRAQTTAVDALEPDRNLCVDSATGQCPKQGITHVGVQRRRDEDDATDATALERRQDVAGRAQPSHRAVLGHLVAITEDPRDAVAEVSFVDEQADQ